MDARQPSIEIVARDRAGAYSEAAEIALPHAVQVRDRWHLLSNLRDNVERMLQRMGPQMRHAAQRVVVTDATLGRQGRGHGQTGLTWWQQLSDDRRSIRPALYERVMALHAQGCTMKASASAQGVRSVVATSVALRSTRDEELREKSTCGLACCPGHVNSLKFLKRQMYGRASIDLLRLRVLNPN